MQTINKRDEYILLRFKLITECYKAAIPALDGTVGSAVINLPLPYAALSKLNGSVHFF